MKRKILLTTVGALVALLSLFGAPAYADGHGGGEAAAADTATSAEGDDAGFSGGAHFSGGGRGYNGAGISGTAGTYAPRSYSSGISTGGYGGYGQRYYAPRTSTGTQIYGSSARPQNRTASRQFAHSPNYSGSYYVPRDQSGVGVARKSDMQSRYYSGANRDVRQQRAGVTARGATPPRAWSRQNAANRQRLDPQTKQRLRNWQGKAPGWNDAKHNHQEHWHDRQAP